MKEATGELNMTVITLVAIAAIGAVFYFLLWPLVQRTLATNSCRTAYGPDFTATEGSDRDDTQTSQARVSNWCCVNNKTGEQHDLATGEACTTGN